MNEESLGDGESHSAISTEEELREALRDVLAEAAANGVDVDGRWSLLRSNGAGTWTVDIAAGIRTSTFSVDDADSPVTAIVEAVAAREDVETTDLPPLHDAIDYDILAQLLRGESDDQLVQFGYCGYDVTVRADGTVRLEQ